MEAHEQGCERALEAPENLLAMPRELVHDVIHGRKRYG